MLLLRRVLGDSMVPTLVPGTIVLAVRSRRIRPGDIVMIRHNGLDKIKRVADMQFNKVFLRGDNPISSTDSRDFGWLHVGQVIGRVVWPVRRGSRRRARGQ